MLQPDLAFGDSVGGGGLFGVSFGEGFFGASFGGDPLGSSFGCGDFGASDGGGDFGGGVFGASGVLGLTVGGNGPFGGTG